MTANSKPFQIGMVCCGGCEEYFAKHLMKKNLCEKCTIEYIKNLDKSETSHAE